MAYNLYLNKVAYKNGEGSETDSGHCRHPTHIPWALTIPWGSLASSSGPGTLGLRAYFIWCFTEFFKQD